MLRVLVAGDPVQIGRNWPFDERAGLIVDWVGPKTSLDRSRLGRYDLVVVGTPHAPVYAASLVETLGPEASGTLVVYVGDQATTASDSGSARVVRSSFPALASLLRLLGQVSVPVSATVGAVETPDVSRLPVGVYRSTPSGVILEANDAMAAILGFADRAALCATNAIDLYVNREDRELLKALALEQGVVRGHETRLRRRDGRQIWVEINLRTLPDGRGGIAWYEGVLIDITERKLAEDELWESERRLRVLVEGLPVLLWCTDTQPVITLCVGAALNVTGIRPNQVMGKALDALFGTGDAGTAATPAHQRALQGESVAFEVVLAGRAFECYLEPARDPMGAIVGTLGVALDVTERRRVEQDYRDLVDSVNAVVWRADPDTYRYRFVSREAERLLGFPLERWTEPDFWLSHLHPEDREWAVSLSRDTAMEEQRAHEYEYRLIRVDGGVVWVRDTVRVVEEKGRGRELVGVMVDITEQKRGQAVRLAVYGLAERATRATSLQELFRGIHEVVAERMPARNLYIALYDDSTDMLTFPYFVDERDPPPAPLALGKGLTEHVLRSGEPLLATPEVFEQLIREGLVLRGTPSVDWIGVPLRTAGRTIGVLAVQSYAESVRYGEAERDVLFSLSEYAAGAIERIRHEHALRRTVSVLESILESAIYGILVVDRTGRVISRNSRFARLWGIPSEELDEIKGEKLLACLADKLRDPDAFLLRARQLARRPEEEAFDVLALKDGRFLEVHAQPQRLGGRAVGRVYNFREASWRRRTERPLE